MSAIEMDRIYTGHNGICTSSTGSTYEGWVYGKANSADGIGCKHRFYNASGKAIKYVTFTYLPYNQVEDVVSCLTTGKSEASGRLTGPVDPKEECEVEWDVLWYNPTVKKVNLKEVFVQYMDGTEETIAGDEVLNIYTEGSEYKKEKALKEAAEAERKAAEDARKKQQREEAMQSINALKDSVVGGLKGLFKKK